MLSSTSSPGASADCPCERLDNVNRGVADATLPKNGDFPIGIGWPAAGILGWFVVKEGQPRPARSAVLYRGFQILP
jgi:hypothetical protein